MKPLLEVRMVTSYTSAQRDAIHSLDRHLQIIACAGSGKTEVVAERIVRILQQPDVGPANVVAFTFTEKAAAEVKERVHSKLARLDPSTSSGAEPGGPSTRSGIGDSDPSTGSGTGDSDPSTSSGTGEAPRGRVLGLAEMYIGTMHGYCLELLHRYVPDSFRYNVLTEITQRLLIDRASTKSGLSVCPTSSPGTPHLQRWKHSKLFMQVTAILREDEIDEELVPDGVWKSFVDYVTYLGDKSYLDYTEMINLVVQLLESNDPDDGGDMLRHHVWEDLKYLVVDEYQDCNPLQERLVAGLVSHGANLCVVGDDDQTIYQWRGSEVGNILTFASRYGGDDLVDQVTLDDNFRSSKGVVEVGRAVAETIQHRLPKQMTSSSHQEWQRGDLLALDFADAAAEAEWICDRILDLRGVAFRDSPTSEQRGLSWSDMAVLYRSVSRDSQPLVDAMKTRGIPYVIKGLNKLFESDEISAVVNLFRYVVGQVDAAELCQSWLVAQLIPETQGWTAALDVLDTGRDFERGSRWGTYNIQRLYLDLLEALAVREDTIPGTPERAELVFYQLGKFSQAISDFEEIHFSSSPRQKYESFVSWLEHQAPDYYADVDAGDQGYATPDAVTIATVHQAKGMQWPAVFVPCLRQNRFPAKRQGGLNVFHIIPTEGVRDPDRYRGTRDDEARLFYVAVTRAQKYLAMSYSPTGQKLYGSRSEFLRLAESVTYVSTKASPVKPDVPRLPPTARHETPQVTMTFSELKYYFECPYQFKLRFLYGFNAPIHEALGYGKGVHDALAEVHKRALDGDLVGPEAARELVRRHLHTPYAYDDLRLQLEKAAVDAIERYFARHGSSIANTIHSEKQIQVNLGNGVVVDGRIDLIRRIDTGETSVVDFKSTDRAQAEHVTWDQLHVYALGYEELTGTPPDVVEVLNLDEQGKSDRDEVNPELLTDVRARVLAAGESLRTNTLPRHEHWCDHCDTCDLAALCRTKAQLST